MLMAGSKDYFIFSFLTVTRINQMSGEVVTYANWE